VVTPARVIAAICVILPFVAVLWVPIYDKDKPEVAGFPFFFWWQLLWVGITAGLMGLAYFVVRREDLARKAAVAAPSADAGPAEAGTDGSTGSSTDGSTGSGTDAGTDSSDEEGDAQ
jgi:hypothetical protein